MEFLFACEFTGTGEPRFEWRDDSQDCSAEDCLSYIRGMLEFPELDVLFGRSGHRFSIRWRAPDAFPDLADRSASDFVSVHSRAVVPIVDGYCLPPRPEKHLGSPADGLVLPDTGLLSPFG